LLLQTLGSKHLSLLIDFYLLHDVDARRRYSVLLPSSVADFANSTINRPAKRKVSRLGALSVSRSSLEMTGLGIAKSQGSSLEMTGLPLLEAQI
jgi:hypothetical protein